MAYRTFFEALRDAKPNRDVEIGVTKYIINCRILIVGIEKNFKLKFQIYKLQSIPIDRYENDGFLQEK